MIHLFVVAILLVFLWYLKEIYRPRDFPPGPQWQPFLGNARVIRKLAKKLGGQHLAFHYLAKKYNTNILGLKLGGQLCIVVNTYNLARQILVNEEFDGRADNFFVKLRCMGVRSGITCTDGPLWVDQRKFVERYLKSVGYGRKKMENMIIKEANVILHIINDKKNEPLQFDHLIAPSVLNVLWTLVTGKSCVQKDPRLINLLNVLNARCLAFDMAGGFLNSFPWLRFIMPEKIGYKLIVKLNEKLKEFFQETISEHHKSWKENRQDDLIYSFITQMKMNPTNQNFTDHQLLAICLDLFFGGSITTSSTINFIFLALVMHPHIQEKAAKFLQADLSIDQPITYADRFKVPYLDAVILEAERLYGVVPINAPRRVLKDTVLDGYKIKKDTLVYMNFYSIKLDEQDGIDSNKFLPERFINEEGKLISNERELTFALGRRRCLGETLARQCIFIFVSSILRKYTIIQTPESEPLSDKPIPGIHLTPNPYQVQFILR